LPTPEWINLDGDVEAKAQVFHDLPTLPFDRETAEEIFGSHVLEHLTFDEAQVFLAECFRVLKPGGRLGLVVPDGRQIIKRLAHNITEQIYIEDRWYEVTDLDDVCTVFLYGGRHGINADSQHKWLYNVYTLSRAMAKHGFVGLTEIDRYHDPRLTAPAWFQCGVDGFKP
jgi:predicted SAM-dependent methyltransferase